MSLSLEDLLRKSPLIQHAAIFGAGRFLNGALVSPATPLEPYTPATVSAFLDAIWPHITHNVNSVVAQHSRLVRTLVLVTDPSRPLLLTDKGTVRSKMSLAMYSDEIDAAYRALEEGGFEEADVPSGGFVAGVQGDALSQYIREVITKVMQREVGDDEDLFIAGLDSLLAVRVRSAVITALRRSDNKTEVPNTVVYTYPTISGLVGYIRGVLSSGVANGVQGVNFEREISEAIERYTANFPVHKPAEGAAVPVGKVYVVTGTTGSLGSAFTSVLLGKDEVKKLYLLNRKSNTSSVWDRHVKAFQDKGLDVDMLASAVKSGRVEFLEVDLAKPQLGLDSATYAKVCS